MSEDGKYTIVRDIYERLKELSVESRIKEPIGKMVLKSSFLVEEKREREFDTRVSELDEKYGDKIRFNYDIGPVPPYNLVNLEVEWR